MQTELFEHAARVLDRADARCLSARALHQRTCRETGMDTPFGPFLDGLAARPDRFTLLEPLLAAEDVACWNDRERAAYGAALFAAGCTGGPVVMTSRRAEPHRTADLRPPAGPADAAAAGLLDDVHGALADLLRVADDSLRRAIGSAAAELQGLQRVIGGVAGVGGADNTGARAATAVCAAAAGAGGTAPADTAGVTAAGTVDATAAGIAGTAAAGTAGATAASIAGTTAAGGGPAAKSRLAAVNPPSRR